MATVAPVYTDVSLLIDGQWRAAEAGGTLPIMNPATGKTIGQHARAEQADLEAALAAADKGFAQWRDVSAYDRSKILKKTATLLRERADNIAPIMTMEQGKDRKSVVHG